MSAARDPRRLVGVALLGACFLAACATQSSRMNADTFSTRKALARGLMQQGDWSPAFAYVDGMHRERPRDAEVLVLRGTIYRERALWTESEADLVEAVRLDERSAEAHAALGILYDVTFRAPLAEAQHRAAVKLAPEAPGYLNNLGFSLFLRGKPREALQYYEKAATLDPMNRRVRTNMGFAFATTGDLRRAAHEFEMGGTPAEAKNNLGFAYERRGDLPRAYDLYLEATHLDPKSTHARSNLVHAAQLLGREAPAAPPQDAAVAPSAVAPSVVAPSAVAPSAVAPSVVAPSAVAPSAVAPSVVAPSAVVPSAVAPSVVVPPSIVRPALGSSSANIDPPPSAKDPRP